ncbi:MAG: TPM domain-containing protein, partial [Bacillota bacterium]|nr:TPM domain-containing protein [Bacillota bacterium]
MKRFFSIFIGCLLCVLLMLSMAVSADETPSVVDNADLLTTEEEASLAEALEQVSTAHQFDLVVVTTPSCEGKTPMEFADDFYDYNGYGSGVNKDGALFLVSMEDRDWWISTTGFGITAFTDWGIDYIGEQVVPSLSDGQYYDAFMDFATLSDDFLVQAEKGEAYDQGNHMTTASDYLRTIGIALAVGLAVALIVLFSLRAQLKSVKRQPAAR